MATVFQAMFSFCISLKSDLAIMESIEDEFFWSPFVDHEDVNVSVSDGVATLTGTVEIWAERRAGRRTPSRAAPSGWTTTWTSTTPARGE